MTTETSAEIIRPSPQASSPTLPNGYRGSLLTRLLLFTQGGPGERGPRGTPGVRGPRGDPVSHALGLSRGDTETGVEHRSTQLAMPFYWCLCLSFPAFYGGLELPGAVAGQPR